MCVCVLLSFCIGSFVVCISEDGLSVKWINVLVVGFGSITVLVTLADITFKTRLVASYTNFLKKV